MGVFVLEKKHYLRYTMMKMRSFVCFLMGALACATIVSANTGNAFRHIEQASGNSQVSVSGLYQDEYGRMWINARDGIKTYTGNRLVRMFPEYRTGGRAPSLTGDRQGHLYFCADYRVIECDLGTEQTRTVYTQRSNAINPDISFNYSNDKLWIGHIDSIYTYKSGVLKPYCTVPLANPSTVISAVLSARNGDLFVGTSDDGLFRIDSNLRRQRVLRSTGEIFCLYEDSKANVWVGTFNAGLFMIAPDGKITNFTEKGDCALASNYVRTVCEDNDGQIWVGTVNGADRIDLSARKVEHFGLSEGEISGLSNLSVWIIIKDNRGTMWFGTYYGGIDYYNPRTNVFDYERVGKPDQKANYPIISSIVEVENGDLWIGTEGNGLIRHNLKTSGSKIYTAGPNSVPHNNIKYIHVDNEERIWIGTHLGGLCCYDQAADEFAYYTIDPSDPLRRSESVHAIVRVDKRFLLGTLGGIYSFDPVSGVSVRMDEPGSSIHMINAMIVDGERNMWVTGNGLMRYNLSDGSVRDFNRELAELTNSAVTIGTCMIEEPNGNILIGTSGNGVIRYNPRTDRFARFNNQNSGLASDYIGCLFYNGDGSVFIGTSAGLTYLDMHTGQSSNFDVLRGFPITSMMPGTIVRTRNGSVVFGGMNGIAVMQPGIAFADLVSFKMWFSELTVNGKEILPGDGSNILDVALVETRKIVLNSYQNSISVEFGHDNFTNYGMPEYQYRLEGLDKEWQNSTGAPISYINLSPGKYTLKVRAVFILGDIPTKEMSMDIVIRHPFYASWYSYLAYILIAALVTLIVVNFYHSSRKVIETERREREQKDEDNRENITFFTNISHELRTPLTLIVGQLELLLMSGRLKGDVHKSLGEILKSGNKMNRLIDELLEYMKHSHGISLQKVRRQDLVAFVSQTHHSFESFAQLKEIDFAFRSDFDALDVWFDEMQVQKVFDNLISNAFKYTPNGGRIEISIVSSGDKVRVMVRDNGIGVPPEMHHKVFDRFFRIGKVGSGIGLSLCKSIVEAHNGLIWVESAEQGGSVFIVELYADDRVFDNNPNAKISEVEERRYDAEFMHEDKEYIEHLATQQQSGEQRTLLIVEDDHKLRRLLVRIFEPLFCIYEAADGLEGLKAAGEYSPDLIISDVMMPNLSGVEFCAKIKSDFNTSHIPVVLVTVLDSTQRYLQGINCGADDYVTKPFNVKVLVSKCMAILNNRALLREKFSREKDSSVQVVTSNKLDRDFMDRAIEIVEQNVEYGNIDVNILCLHMGISRSKLFLKIKGIMGQTPHEFIQTIKLKVAANMLLENEEMSIGDIAINLGFSSLNYFGKYFRNNFGVSPSVYRKQFLKRQASASQLPDEDEPHDGAE